MPPGIEWDVADEIEWGIDEEIVWEDTEKDEEIILVGDFNEPSHLDWTLEAANQGLNFGFEVNWPISSNLELIGMVDTYREIFPNPIQYPGYTWTPVQSSNEVHDRIDFIYYSGKMDLQEVYLVGPDHLSDIVIDYFESDHRAVFSKFTL